MTAAHGPSTVAAVLVAGGSGRRLGAPLPKAFAEIEDETLLGHAAWRFLTHRRIGSVVVVAPASHLDEACTVVDDLRRRADELEDSFAAVLRAVGQAPAPTPTLTLTSFAVVPGGVTRQASVLAGLDALGADVEFVLVHDVARPFVPKSVIDSVLDALCAGADAVVPVLPVHDTIRRVDATGGFAGVVDRSELVAVQTPQGFRRVALVEAHAAGAGLTVTDDAALVEAMGGTVVAVEGADELFKITRPWDLAVAEAMLEARALDG